MEIPSKDSIINHAYALLKNGAEKRDHDFHLMAVASHGEDGFPDSRSVVLRAHDPIGRSIAFHSDIRSRKVQQLKANPKVNILLYDKESKVQLRIPAVAKIYHQDEVAQSRWELSQLTSRKCYMTDIASGVVMNRPFSTRHDMDLQIDGYEYFTAILCHYDRFEYMHLTAEGHERAFITFDGNEIMLEWRAP